MGTITNLTGASLNSTELLLNFDTVAPDVVTPNQLLGAVVFVLADGATSATVNLFIFADATITHPLFPWIEALVAAEITGGCATSPPQYCPDAAVTRGEMAVFLLRAKHGAGYRPPDATGMFTDVPGTHPFVKWIEQLAREGITGGCSTSPSQYCPDGTVTRGQMAVFLVRTFNLPM